MKEKKYSRAQASMEFMMNYGWAFVIILLAGVLFFKFVDFGSIMPNDIHIEKGILQPLVDSSYIIVNETTNEGMIIIAFEYVGADSIEFSSDSKSTLFYNFGDSSCDTNNGNISIYNADTNMYVGNLYSSYAGAKKAESNSLKFLSGNVGYVIFAQCENFVERGMVEGEMDLYLSSFKTGVDTPYSGNFKLQVVKEAVIFKLNESEYVNSGDEEVIVEEVVVPVIPEGVIVSDSFISVWDTTKTSAGSSAENQIKLPLESAGTYNFVVNWGDGTSDTITSWNQAEVTHTYPSSGIYRVNITGQIKGFSFNVGGDRLKIEEIRNWGKLNLGNSGSYFRACSNLDISANDVLDLNGTTDLSWAFSNLKDFSGDPSSWDVSSVTNMNQMFYGTSSFNGDISSWDVSSVTTFYGIFYGVSSFNQDIGDWNMSSAGNIGHMFSGASSFNQDIGSWDTSNVYAMPYIFRGATNFNQDISGWNTSKVNTMYFMFQRATSFNQDISGWDTSSARYMTDMFRDATSFNQNLSSWDVSKVTDMGGMFLGATNFNGDISSWDVSSVTNMGGMFYVANNFNQDISSWDVSSVTNMGTMFGYTKFNQDISSWDVSNVKYMNTMFMNAYYFNQDLSSWDTSSATNMARMFVGAKIFNQDLSSWDVSKVTDAWQMFDGTALSTMNYDKILTSWNSLPSLQSNIRFGAGNTIYTSAASSARQNLIDTYGWNIVDGGEEGSYEPFISTWDSSKLSSGSSANNQIRLPLQYGGGYNFVIDWGDGNVDQITSYDQAEVTHTYSTPGVYELNMTGLIRGFRFNLGGDRLKILDISKWGSLNPGEYYPWSRQFAGCENLDISASDSPDLTGVKTLNELFRDAKSLSTPDFTSWDLSGVTQINGMFKYANSFNGDISTWDTSNVITTAYMFDGASSFNGDISSWDMSNVQVASVMFQGASSFNQDISSWDMGKNGHFWSMFNGASSFNQNLSVWNTSSAVSYSGFDTGATSWVLPKPIFP